MAKIRVKDIPCSHIADYYQSLWEANHTIGWNLLRLAYRQWAEGYIWTDNNLYD